MALPPLAAIGDLEARIGEPIKEVAERERAVAVLTDASTLVRDAAGATLVNDTGDVDSPPDIAVAITLAAAVRAWYNPAGVSSGQIGASTFRFAGDVWLTAAERGRLSSLSGQTITSVEMTHGFGFDGLPSGYVPVDYGDGQAPYADWFPLGY